MNISTRGRYGIRFLMDVVAQGGQENVPLREVAHRQGISEKYLWQVVTPLKTAGLIRAVPGPGGGYTLARPPDEVSLREIMAILEGEGSDDVQPVHGKPDQGNAAVAREIWTDMESRIGEILASVTLRDMDERRRLRMEREALSYVI